MPFQRRIRDRLQLIFLLSTLVGLSFSEVKADEQFPSIQYVLDQCGEPDDEDFSCRGITYCGDGGCDPRVVTVVLDRSLTDTFGSTLERLPITKVVEMTDQRGDPTYFDDPNWDGKVNYYPGCLAQTGFDRDGRYIRSELTGEGRDVVEYCLEVAPGREIEIAYFLSNQPWAIYVGRTGGDAGSPPAYLDISLEQFLSLRQTSDGPLLAAVRGAVEQVIGGSCQTSTDYRCAVVPAMGQVEVAVVFHGNSRFGERGVWYRVEMSVFSYVPSSNWYSIVFSMPITQIRRWPSNQGIPTEGFQSVDEDAVFEMWRASIMSSLAVTLQAELVEP